MSERELYFATAMPTLQNKLFRTAEAARNCPIGDVRLVENQKTGLVYNHAFDPSLVKYDIDYNNDQTVSNNFQKHLYDVSTIIERTLGRKALLEVGCGKGNFLEILQSQDFEITGFDATYEGNNPAIEASHFNADMDFTANGIILRHVLEHIAEPLGFLEEIQQANNHQGLIYIEVPCLDWILEHCAWFDVFYEHVNYFRLRDFYNMFADVVAAGHIFGGQYIYVVARLDSLRTPSYQKQYRVEFPINFDFSVKEYVSETHPGIVWGGGSKGVIFSLILHRAGRTISHVIDIDTRKQQKYLPVSGLKVNTPKILDDVDDEATIYVMNSNYMEEIRQMTQDRFIYRGIDND